MICPLLTAGLLADPHVGLADNGEFSSTFASNATDCRKEFCEWYCVSYPAHDDQQRIGQCAMKWFGDSIVRKWENGGKG